MTLDGSAYGPIDKQSALIDASYIVGVKDVVDHIQVDPISMMDDRIRVATARAVYGYPWLSMYAIDPVKPIRIAVQNGDVTLVGIVISHADKKLPGFVRTAFLECLKSPMTFRLLISNLKETNVQRI